MENNKYRKPTYINKIQIIVFFDVSYKNKHNKIKQNTVTKSHKIERKRSKLTNHTFNNTFQSKL